MQIMNRRPKQKKQRTGATAVEFAIVAPVFFLILFAMFEFSHVNVLRHTADNAAYEASRVAIIPGATAADAVAEANRLLTVVGTRNANVTVTPPVIDESVDQVTVSVDVPMSRNSLIMSRFMTNSTLHSESTLRTERVRTR